MPLSRYAVLVSGGGTNLQSLIDSHLPAKIVCVISSKEGAYALERAKKAGIETRVIQKKDYKTKADFDRANLAALRESGADFIVLAGYMQILGKEMVEAYKNRIINIHPALIPSFCGMGYFGLHVHEAVLAYGAKITGATVHLVDGGADTGPIVLQEAVPVKPGDTPEELQQRVMKTEHRLLPRAVRLMSEGKISVSGRIVTIKEDSMAKRAFLSVFDKTGIVDFAKGLGALGFEILSTGGTQRELQKNGVPVTNVSDVTGFPECLDGRVKTLHPVIHAGLLAMRSNPEHMEQIKALGIQPIDVVAVNLYPFKQTIMKDGVTLEEAVENIDIGGPTMLRAAAKNWQDVAVIVDNADYEKVIAELTTGGEVSRETKFTLAAKVFANTAAYDALIAQYLREQTGDTSYPEKLTLTYEKSADMRYGENPHQSAAFYREPLHVQGSLVNAKQLNGKDLSFNNINDANGALDTLREFDGITVVGLKHANPCGVGTADTVYNAYMKAYESDPVSIFGGIVASNSEIDSKTAEEMAKIFLEIVIAPSYTQNALDILCAKKNLRVLELPDISAKLKENSRDAKKVLGGLLVQQSDAKIFDGEIKTVTKREPTAQEKRDLDFAFRVVKHVKSNGIAIARDSATVGVGPGQTNRIWAAQMAIERAGDKCKGAVMASDAFFPFDDCVEAAAKAGVTAIIQPGGSIRDEDSIKKCDEYGIAMVFTGIRHFKH